MEGEIDKDPLLWDSLLSSLSREEDIFGYEIVLTYSVDRHEFLRRAERLLTLLDFSKKTFKEEATYLACNYEEIWEAYHKFDDLFHDHGIALFFQVLYHRRVVKILKKYSESDYPIINAIYQNLYRIRKAFKSPNFRKNEEYVVQMVDDMVHFSQTARQKRVRHAAMLVLEVSKNDSNNAPKSEILLHQPHQSWKRYPNIIRGGSAINLNQHKLGNSRKQSSVGKAKKKMIAKKLEPRVKAKGGSSNILGNEVLINKEM